jgi:hypothetical protein
LADDLPALLREVAVDKRASRAVTMAKASLADGQALYAVNDLFIGARTHTSAVYEIALDTQAERQSSSGLIVATGLGSTAWFKSIVTGSLAIAGAFGGGITSAPYAPQAWDSDELRFAVREPFPSRSSQVSLVCGRLTKSGTLKLRSLMPENGVIFSDGIEVDRLDFNSGTEAQITVAERQGRLIV